MQLAAKVQQEEQADHIAQLLVQEEVEDERQGGGREKIRELSLLFLAVRAIAPTRDHKYT